MCLHGFSSKIPINLNYSYKRSNPKKKKKRFFFFILVYVCYLSLVNLIVITMIDWEFLIILENCKAYCSHSEFLSLLRRAIIYLRQLGCICELSQLARTMCSPFCTGIQIRYTCHRCLFINKLNVNIACLEFQWKYREFFLENLSYWEKR